VFGLLGFIWRHGGQRAAFLSASLLAGAFILEPLAWSVWEYYLPNPAAIWIVEAGIGAALSLGLSLIRRRRRVGTWLAREEN
jgi:hypothetical protein